ncbi:UDP-N-acetylmuramoyl-tripeptide--D-alanyl-D-alanine ligase [Mariprofundus erugo]|uniref:UDP-N-acetylmuramoyl-tripeptide--D-alanyl-D- alanine ligase n=1 Tax=Mariprofundus erugo TaxID=2528639 RepID=UPI0010FD9B9D|nr:UDP-N-acetylmuramoyl-tripeptide--D-alanyl-D-alanine ligase [Mariprofundus erugo]TLS77107.1 UDP-N-acetylmuramoyl-tripeptide--D-alanyl-D-alanine ligase [Mariprofundus erugo]
MYLTGADLQRATAGQWLGGMPDAVTQVVTDTRGFTAGSAFLALRGPHYDGHLFAGQIAERASLLIGDHEGIKRWSELSCPQLQVNNTLQALGDIAHAWRMQLANTTVVAISGSYGKTSLRSLLQHGLSALGMHVAATTGNLNNLVGVPKTLMAVPKEAGIALIECGISECGEMARLSAMVQPDVAVLTGITAAHGEGLGGMAGVVREKSALFDHLNEGGWCMLGEGVGSCLDQYGVARPAGAIDIEQQPLQWQLEGKKLRLDHGTEHATIELQLPARHWAANMTLAASLILRLMANRGVAVSLAEVAGALVSWQPEPGRMQICTGIEGCTVLDDCYNANPVSMQAAINTLAVMQGNRVAVLGDMAELGAASDAAHAGLDVSEIDQLYLVGAKMEALAIRSPKARWYPDSRAAAASLSRENFGPTDTVLVKGSRSMTLEAVVNVLCSGGQQEVRHAL